MERIGLADRAIEVRLLIKSGEARQRRIDAGLSLETSARKVGVSTAALFRWERNERHPQGRNLVAYHKFLTRLASQDA